MSFLAGLFKGLAGLIFGALALGLLSVTAAPTASFTITPDGNPVVGQTVVFADSSTGSPTSWSWNFGDGQSSTQQNATHAYAAPGSFNVTLTASNVEGPSQKVQPLIVSPIDTLRLNASHPFLVKLVATNQHNGDVQGPGQAIPQNDLFGYFSLPSLTSNPDNPEVFVKILDGRPINGQFWVFFGHLTDLIYDITVTEVATGFVKTYHKDAGNSAGGFDTSGFSATATPTITRTPTMTPTPTAPALIVTNLVASNFEWNFDASGLPEFTMRVGQAYRINITRANGTHEFTGLQKTTDFSNLGCSSSNFNSSPTKICNMTPTTANIGTYLFGCSVPSCGSGHGDMQNGVVRVVP